MDLPATVPVDRGEAADEVLAAEVETLAVDFVKDQGIPGLSVALVDGGEVVYAGGFGWADVTAERPMLATTPVLLSSVSKTFVGVAATQAADAGLDLDTPVADLLGYPFPVAGATLRHLLTHHSGLEDSKIYDQLYAEGDPTIALPDLCEGYLTPKGAYWRADNVSNRGAGEGFSYSNVGMACAAQALAAHTGRPMRELVEDILEPLGMTRTAYFLEDLTDAPAVPYQPSRQGPRPFAQYGYPTYPDGMIRSPAVDMAKFMAAMGGKGRLQGQRVISEAGWQAMVHVDPDLGTDEDGQALAWAMRELDGVPLLGHNGGDYGSAAEIWFNPETGDGFSLVANGLPLSFEAAIELERRLMALVDER